ncbi:hypothetical protein C6376_24970 [Streptomyces sp. P3]|nr:hypothetical protein C6376_24970 [Streptomyces sp. P3]
MDAAERLMGAHGFHATSVSALCKLSGWPMGSLYHHFGSKTGLLVAVLERGISRVDAAVDEAVSRPVPPSDQAYVYFDAVAKAVDDNAVFHRLLAFVLLERTTQPEVRKIVEPFRNRLLAGGTEQMLVTLRHHDGDVTRESAQTMAQSLTGWLVGIFVLDVPDRRSRVAHEVRLRVQAGASAVS